MGFFVYFHVIIVGLASTAQWLHMENIYQTLAVNFLWLLVCLPFLLKDHDYFVYLKEKNQTGDYTFLPFAATVFLISPNLQSLSQISVLGWLMILLTVFQVVWYIKITNNYRTEREKT